MKPGSLCSCVVMAFGLLAPGALPRSAAAVLQWDFESNLESSSGHPALALGSASPAVAPELAFEEADIAGAAATVARLSRGTYLELSYALAANGGGRSINEFTVIVDVLFPDRSTTGERAALVQLDRENSDDAEWLIDANGALGVAGRFGGSLADGQWYRLAWVVSLSTGTIASYVDGVEVQRSSGHGVDGRYSLQLDSALVFADQDGESAAVLVNSLQLRDSALDAESIAALGGPVAAGIPLEEEPEENLPGVVDRWSFGPDFVSGRAVPDRSGTHDGSVHGAVALSALPPSLVLDGSTSFVELAGDPRSELPRAFSAEAWVSLNSGTRWGGIIGYVQDNGSFEKGWVLGYDSTSFNIALSTQGKLSYFAGGPPYQLGAWHHVVGTYDGSALRIYVDGKLGGTNTSHSGNIDYAPSTYVIGCYLDDNEFYPLDGRIHEVRVYDKALTAAEVRANYESKKGDFPTIAAVAFGPYLQFLDRDVAMIHWETSDEMPSILEYGDSQALGQRVEDSGLKRVHEIVISGLEPNTEYFYVIEQLVGGEEFPSAVQSFSTEFNYSVPSFDEDLSPFEEDALTPVYAAAAARILEETGITRGLCLDYSCGQGRLALELARRSELRVFGLNEDAEAVALARSRLKAAGVYGSRITIHHGSLSALPYTENCFNLVVSDDLISRGEPAGLASEAFRVLRPDGGTMFLGQPPGVVSPLDAGRLEAWVGAADLEASWVDGDGSWLEVVAGALEGAGAWTHMYGDPGNSANSGDLTVSGAAARLQWFGLPGPRGFMDRQSRNPAPLTADGRLYTFGDDRLLAQDAYNGSTLWSLDVPGMRRVNIPRDAGSACTDGPSLYVAVRDDCWRIDGQSGEIVQVYCVADGGAEGEGHEWGYVATVDELLYGSQVREGSKYSEFRGPDKWYDARTGGFGTAMVCSDDLFARDKETGDTVWSYSGGVILDSTIALGDGRIFFVECRRPSILSEPSRRILSPDLWKDQYIVALDAWNGAKLWERPSPFSASPLPVVFYLVYAEGTLLASMSTDHYTLQTFRPESGAPIWTRSHAFNRDNHGGHMYHPVVVAGTVIVEPRVYDLATGDPITTLPSRGGCSTMSASGDTVLYVDWDYHNGSLGFWDLDSNRRTRRAGSRSSCWLNLVSGGGLILVPTGSAGCTCRYPLQTSIGYKTW